MIPLGQTGRRKTGAAFVLPAFLAAAISAWAQYPLTEFHVSRTRLFPDRENYSAAFVLQLDWSQLPLGSNSTAQLSHVIGGQPWSATADIVPQDDHGWFSFSVSLPAIADANGEWTYVLDPGTAPGNPRRFTIADLSLDQFPPYPAWPLFGYDGDPHQVYLSITNSLIYQTGFSFYGRFESSTNLPGAQVCIYSNGGPYRIDLELARNLGPLPILDVESNLVGEIDYPFMQSWISARFQIADASPGSPELAFESGSSNGFLVCQGLTTGQPALLRVSTNLETWTDWLVIPSPASAMSFELDRAATKQFFMLAQ